MSSSRLSTPVALIVFNRPETTVQVFEVIRKARPSQLLVIADGPRADHPEDTKRCAAARAIVDRIDWRCQLHTDFSDTNMGCKRRISSGLDWVFDTVGKAIILEDDCLPHQTFFRFCEELLEEYRDDERIMMVSGDNFQFGRRRTEHSYYFSRYPHCWGWATWRRAWRHYDGGMQLWPMIRDGGWMEDLFADSRASAFWHRIFDRAYNGQIDAWAYPWTFACWIRSGLSILPNVNLVSNIGFGTDATHTHGSSEFANLPTEPMQFPVEHPPFVIRDAKADRFTQRNHFNRRTLRSVVKAMVRNLVSQCGPLTKGKS